MELTQAHFLNWRTLL